jgi:hypothetical protein
VLIERKEHGQSHQRYIRHLPPPQTPMLKERKKGERKKEKPASLDSIIGYFPLSLPPILGGCCCTNDVVTERGRKKNQYLPMSLCSEGFHVGIYITYDRSAAE